MASLFVIRGTDQGARFDLDDPTVSIGRDSTNRIQLHDKEVSRHHAEFHLDGSECTLADLGSSNGTFINSQRIERSELTSGDQVQFGRTILLFTGTSEEATENLTDQIDIVSTSGAQDSSRIVSSVSQKEGSRLFVGEGESAESPWLARARSNLQIMYRTALAVSHTLDIDQLLSRIMDLIFEWVEADRGCIMLIDPETEKLRPKARRDRNSEGTDEKLSISQTILDYVMEHNEGVLSTNAKEDSRWNPAASIVQQGIREAICVPMQGRYDLVGVIYIDALTPPEEVIRKDGANKFSDEHLKLMIAIGHQAALAVEDTNYYSAMVQAERLAAVGQTIATLSHHIKNILQGIRGGSYLIEIGLSDHDESVVKKGWDIVEKNQTKISNLVLDMLTFSKEREPELLAGDLNEVIGDVVELMETRARDLNVELQWRPCEEMPTLTFDPEGVHRAVLNLVTNAIDACESEEEETPNRVEVSTAYDGKEELIRVVVEDNGRGIDPEDLDTIFTLFVSKKGGRGTGLGLPVTKKIVAEHGGRIDVDSEIGRGSKFTIELPAVPPNAEEEPD